MKSFHLVVNGYWAKRLRYSGARKATDHPNSKVYRGVVRFEKEIPSLGSNLLFVFESCGGNKWHIFLLILLLLSL